MKLITQQHREAEHIKKMRFAISKLLIFGIIYVVSAVFMEGIIILLYSASGYDILHGNLPTGNWVSLVPLYGFFGFGVFTLVYIKLIEKRKLYQIQLVWNKKKLIRFAVNLAKGSILVALMITLFTALRLYEFTGFGSIDPVFLFASFLAYLIQGTAEEIMCRGFLQNTLEERLGLIPAIVISTIAFIAPHILSIVEMDGFLAVTAVINLCLVSCLFSLIMSCEGSVLSACGLHIGWNFMLGVIFGLQVSGGTPGTGLLSFSITGSSALLTGGNYGIEASILLIPLLAAMNMIYIVKIKRKGADYGISKETV
ncbi:MAG TPA: type II CAAX endopeptidase family protein [Lachnospiraceae bacterium]|nr:type II CAAX endopeptidase family protein [Lachnospiraceae bacterium]